MSVLKVTKLTKHAHLPFRLTDTTAGYDLKSAYDYIIPANNKSLISTDLMICVPDGTYGRIAPRSGISHKHFLDIGAGVIDADYRGNVQVLIFNHGNKDFHIFAGDRIAQLICEKICYPELVEVEKMDETQRGDKGFGSTGI
ncbi:putative deoxyuridine triphosphate nucleotidohydrolase 2 [Diachasmimorpha longicaudata entomopoxvirus]|uniref:Deoxyuridine 5'-triphosphate nucleotidohydrolase n=1 Tax=Diachasmimorpha longicaudata entomopoxvirus TaxID=109981 RepID=A0A7R5WRR6_9POXV|nr:putative deoxyuridine triphosphate nucleotidohydrolase 1 [Diachasmimorpha longicaudata entomopoxvirus]YP_010796934.1 putative deoxyuridine triphosphate nucleotidohydrolase 2 [Diachasmimorpha longicaudata entomopoxvirus]AKS26298.1 putative deoxyuridine triphosphate nucleotidohydrolase 1 [Diachasmimorpha longicaudata entomopoxvirus]AKS26478.1 putative deoxyuridine triphosphate nucleotidohydrolase 2 [Diachasmimorpha longicaudata entomopoxvirus]